MSHWPPRLHRGGEGLPKGVLSWQPCDYFLLLLIKAFDKVTWEPGCVSQS